MTIVGENTKPIVSEKQIVIEKMVYLRDDYDVMFEWYEGANCLVNLYGTAVRSSPFFWGNFGERHHEWMYG